jgi:hypothetical protein
MFNRQSTEFGYGVVKVRPKIILAEDQTQIPPIYVDLFLK